MKCPRRWGKGGKDWVGKEAMQASSTCEFLGSGRQPTPLWPGTCFQEGLPWNTLEDSGDSSAHHRQKTQPCSHPRRAEIWARGFSTQAKELMGLLEAVNVVSARVLNRQAPDQTREREDEAHGGTDCSPCLHHPRPSLAPHSEPRF